MNWKLPLILSAAIYVGLVVAIIFIPGISMDNKFSLCITLALVFVTAYYAIQTGNMVKAMKEQTNKTIKAMQEQTEEMRNQNNLLVEQIREQNRPHIHIFLKEYSNRIYMYIRNVGREYAEDCKYTPDPDFKVRGVMKLSAVINQKLPSVLLGGEERKIEVGFSEAVINGLVEEKILSESKLSEEEKEKARLKANEDLKAEYSPEHKIFITCTYTEEKGECREEKIPVCIL